MRELAFSEVIGTFVAEALPMIDWTRVAAGLGVTILAAVAILWAVSKLLCEEEGRLQATIGSVMALVFTGSVLVLICLARLLRNLHSRNDVVLFDGVFVLGAVIGAIVIFAAVHGAFATHLWKATVLAIVLVGSTGAIGFAAVPLVLARDGAELHLLARQCTGSTSEGPWLVKSEEANGRIRIQRARRERVETRARLEALVPQYSELDQIRRSLRPEDQAGIAAYNQRAADYTRETQTLRAELARAEALVAKADAEERAQEETEDDE